MKILEWLNKRRELHNSIENSPGVFRLMSEFGSILCYKDDLISQQIKDFGNHTRPEFAFATSVLDHSMAVFDLGAHIGTFSLVALRKLHEGSRLLSVEGNPTTFDLLAKNLESRGVTRTATVNAFVGEGKQLRYEPKLGNSGAGRLIPSQETLRGIDFFSIDELVKKYFTPDYIKIDVEGMEYHCLSKYSTLHVDLPIIYLEINKTALSIHGHSSLDLDDLLRPMGYSFFVNSGDRNAKHDIFRVTKIKSLIGYRDFYDVLCIPAHSEKLAPLDRVSAQNST